MEEYIVIPNNSRMEQELKMLTGILCGFAAAFLQSSSYVCSKIFILKHKNSLCLSVYSQICMAVMGILTMPVALAHVRYSLTWETGMLVGLSVLLGAAGQFFFFQTIHEIEASRLSSLLGLKIIILALICMGLFREDISAMQWVAVVLCAASAVGMNFAGAKITWKGGLLLFCTLVCYAGTDILAVRVMDTVEGQSVIWRAVGATALNYTALGIFSALLLFKTGWKNVYLRDAVPYAFCWYSAMLMLFVCFGMTGVIYGNIIQATRGIISVLIGVVLLKAGFPNLEPAVSWMAWGRRLLMAVLMMTAMALYSWSLNS